MIIEENGRYRSVRTQEEMQQMFEQDYESLSDEERMLFSQIIEDLSLNGESPLFDSMSSNIYENSVVSIESFLNDEYFLGEISKTLYPVWKEELIEIFSGGYEEVILGGSIGAGKTMVAVVAILRMLYEVSCLRIPHQVYNVSFSDQIVFPIVSITESVAGEAYGRAAQIVQGSKYFQENFSPRITQENGIVFPKNIAITPPASNLQAIIGKNAFGAMIDESNFFKTINKGATEKNYMKELHSAIKTRMKNRFMQNGRIPGKLIIVSSKGNVDSFTDTRIREAMSDPTVYVVEKASYEIHPKGRYSDETFRVAIGTEMTQSRILAASEPAPEGVNVIEVPVDFKSLFEDDIDAAIREVAGYSTVSITPFIQNRKKIHMAIDPKRHHPFSEYIWKQDFPAHMNWDVLAQRNVDGTWKPIMNPSAPRYVHMDLSKTGDRTGIAVGHINGWKQIQRLGSDPEYAPEFVIDFMLGIQAPTNGEIVYSEIRKLIYQFSSHGFFIKKITADSFQSAAILQTMGQQGYKTDTLSVDLLGPYDIFKQAIYDQRVSYYKYDLFLSEMMKLEKNWKTGKVDHPTNFSKDISDAVCGVVKTLTDESLGQVPFVGHTVDRTQLDDNDESWVLDSAIPVEKNNKGNDTNDWKQEVGKTGSNFNLPFLTG